ncbi:type III secretion protein [Pseudomonas sp. URMO17WK12:I2]|uniref:type III secretion protein n=1 Tax=Pseudomonas sp. URMO17WK12:I2 TaxID=1261623 RepID=UPI0021158573|nr:type III secretion protein [Pseudomonas sp. URMO17WK12:I2]
MFHRPACADSGSVGRCLALALLLLAGSVGTARGEVTPPWFDQPYDYVVINQDLRSTLEAFGRNLGLPMAISSRVKGRAQSNLRAASAGEFLDALCGNGGLTWFFDGNMLHVNSEEEIEIRQFEPSGFQLDELQTALDELGVAGQHLSLRSSFHGDGLLISGPPPYMALVQQRIDQLQSPVVAEPEVVRERGVRVFRGSAGIQVVKDTDE